MAIQDKLEDTLNGGYHGLHGEVVTEDIYRFKELKFIPDFVLDLGANVGEATRFCRTLWPNALIVAVEPDEENFAHLVKFTTPDNIVFLNKAIGQGELWKCKGAANGAHEVYINAGLGYPKELMGEEVRMSKSNVETIMPDELIAEYWKNGMKAVVKIDVEGNEHTVFTHKQSMAFLKKMDYICMEVHFFALTHEGLKEVRDKSMAALRSFEDTHDCEFDVVNFWATKK